MRERQGWLMECKAEENVGKKRWDSLAKTVYALRCKQLRVSHFTHFMVRNHLYLQLPVMLMRFIYAIGCSLVADFAFHFNYESYRSIYEKKYRRYALWNDVP